MSLRQRITEKLAGAVEVDAVLTEMGAPESHLASAKALPRVAPTLKTTPASAPAATAPAGAAADATPQYAGPTRLSLTAVVGGIWSLLFPVMIIVMMLLDTSSGRAAQMLKITQLLGWSAPFATTVLGLLAIGRIQRSGGRLYGLSLALFDALLFPLLLLDLIIVWICWRINDTLRQQGGISPPIEVLIRDIIPTIAVILADYFLVVQAWAALRGSPSKRRR
jgi:hypothetical protein